MSTNCRHTYLSSTVLNGLTRVYCADCAASMRLPGVRMVVKPSPLVPTTGATPVPTYWRATRGEA